MSCLKQYKGYLIDLDGTMYKGKEKIPTAVHFVTRLKEKGIPYLFVTNNSTTTKEAVAERLKQFGVPAEPEDVLTTSMATAQYIKSRKPDATVYHIGEEGLTQALKESGLTYEEESPDYVIVGLDRHVTYEKLAKACLAVRKGATFISTNPDRSLPTERGFLPGNGSITAVVTVSTGVDPIFIGKPEAIIIEQALETMKLPKDETLLVGDNYQTDILAGIHAGIDTLLVYTGVTTKDMLTGVKKMPTYEVATLADWLI